MMRPHFALVLLLLLSSLRRSSQDDTSHGDDVTQESSSGQDFLSSLALNPVYRVPVAGGHVYFAEPFQTKEDFLKRWTTSQVGADKAAMPAAAAAASKYEGLWRIEEMKRNSPRGDLGLVLKKSSTYHAISVPLDKPFEFDNKPLIVQYEVKFQGAVHDCGGAYIKLLTNDEKLDLNNFSEKTPYTIMFGPDKCGNDEKIHFIFRRQNPATGQFEEKHSRPPSAKFGEIFTDKKIHLFTLGVYPNNSFEIFLDQRRINFGSLSKDMQDESMDDKWEPSLTDYQKCMLADEFGPLSQPTDRSPSCKSKLPLCRNSNLKGKLFPRTIPNADNYNDQGPYGMPSISALGMELWSTSSNIFFDNFIVTDDKHVADQWADQGWKPKKAIEIANSKGLRGLMVYLYDCGLERRWLWGIYAFLFLLPFILGSVLFCPESGPLFKASMIANAVRPGEEDEENEAKRQLRKKERRARRETLKKQEEQSAIKMKDKTLQDEKVGDEAAEESKDSSGTDSSDAEASYPSSRMKFQRRKRRN